MKYKELRTYISKKSLNDLVNMIRNSSFDPRSTKKGHGVCVHSFDMLLFIIIISKICGMKSYREIEYFAKTHIVFL